jgi:hypothetical protein
MAAVKKNCLKCSIFLTCREPSKGPRFVCGNFMQLRDVEDIFRLHTIPGASQEDQPEDDEDDEDTEPLPLSRRNQKFVDNSGGESRSPSSKSSAAKRGKKETLDDFIWRAMKDSYDPHTNTVRDLKIDDRDLAQAANYYTFCSEVAGSSIKMPFARQLWIAYNLMGEYCPRCTPKKFLSVDNIPVDMDPRDLKKKVSILENGVCPRCNSTKAEMVMSGDLKDFNQLVLIAGQRAGKSSFTSTISAYYAHRFLKAPRLSTICRGIQDFTPLTFTFIGLTASRAIKLLWNPFSEIISSSSWFQEYFKVLKHAGQQYDKEFFTQAKLYMRFYNKNLDLYPSSPLKRTLRGDTRILAATDELAWFPYKVIHTSATGEEEDDTEEDDERERANADEVHQALENSLATVRTEVLSLYKKGISNVPTGINLNISSPQSEMDKMSRMKKEADSSDRSLTLALRLPTWDISPLYSKDHPIIQDAYRKNAQRAERDFGANPPKLSSSILQIDRVLPLFVPHVPNTHRVLYDTNTPGRTTGTLVEVLAKSEWRAQVMAIDAGLTNNSFAIALGEKIGSRLRVNTLLEIIPARKTEIHYPTLYRQVLIPLIRQCNVAVTGADRWNSVDILQSIGEDTQDATLVVQRTLQRKHLDAFIASLTSQTVDLPSLELPVDFIQSVRDYKTELINNPVSHLLLQMITVREFQGMIGKGEGYTDDLFRTIALLHSLVFNPKIAKKVDERQPKVLNTSAGVTRSAVISRGRSGY